MFCYKILEYLDRFCGGNGIWFGKSRAEGVKKAGKGMIVGGIVLYKGKVNCVRRIWRAFCCGCSLGLMVGNDENEVRR